MLVAGAEKGIRYFFDAELYQQGFVLAFSTRVGGISEPPATREEVSTLGAAFGVAPGNFTFAQQVHGCRVGFVDADSVGAGGIDPIPETDALVTDLSGVPLAIMTADCVPLLLVDPDARVAAAVHAGWKGTLGRIAAGAVEAMKGAGAEPGRIRARIGAAIGPCCFEVGPEVFKRFSEEFGGPAKGSTLDLVELNAAVLRESGVQEDLIESLGMCTSCEPELFYSWRRSKDAGRLVAISAVL